MEKKYLDLIDDLANDRIEDYIRKSLLIQKQNNASINKTFLILENKLMENAFEIPGLYYIKNYITQQEENMILNKIKTEIKFVPITSYPNSRRVAHFGYNYSYNRSGLTKADPIPYYLLKLVGENRLPIMETFNQLIINEYKPGQQIAKHIDHITQFGPNIACITIGKSVPITFESKICDIKSKSMYIMTNNARYKWKHSLKNNTNETRYSLTFRTIT